MNGTVTHSLAASLNNMIYPFINNNSMLKPIDKFLALVHSLTVPQGHVVCSLDVDKLFINVPVNKTINKIIDRA